MEKIILKIRVKNRWYKMKIYKKKKKNTKCKELKIFKEIKFKKKRQITLIWRKKSFTHFGIFKVLKIEKEFILK